MSVAAAAVLAEVSANLIFWVFSARPGTIKQIITVDEPHPRKPDFITSEKFTRIRNRLYSLLHDEIRKAVSQSAVSERVAADKSSREAKP